MPFRGGNGGVLLQESSYTGRIQSLISDHIIKSTTVRIV